MAKSLIFWWIWPNIDAGGDQIAKAIRSFRENNSAEWLQMIKNVAPATYQKLLKRATCAIGNSSSFVRDSTFSGTPVVLLGDRQAGREYGNNLIECAIDIEAISLAIQRQVADGRKPAENLYGDGTASRKIVSIIKEFRPYAQKRLNYPFVDDDSDN